jgi:hypothetical protein
MRKDELMSVPLHFIFLNKGLYYCSTSVHGCEVRRGI